MTDSNFESDNYRFVESYRRQHSFATEAAIDTILNSWVDARTKFLN
ncbi:hypothetical protein [Chamaesiphon sp. VAR_48_metabat_403]|nr:hypothetical protein [Chamaesiphon sp. VAR_48_metabat_403]